jgi:hypothetical protein
MTQSELVTTTLLNLSPNTLFESRVLYQRYFSTEISEANFFKIINRLIISNELTSFSKGVFYIPKQGKNGIIPLSPSTIKSLVISTNKHGCEVGEILYYDLKLTTQKPKTYAYYTNAIVEQKRTYGYALFKRLDLMFDGLITLHIQFMDVLEHFEDIHQINHRNFLSLCESFCKSFDAKTFFIIHRQLNYQKKHVAFLVEILNYYAVKHSLNSLLSHRSKYYIPPWLILIY